MRYERSAVLAGEVWRLATAWWVHLGAWHLGLNLAGALMVTAMFAHLVPVRHQWRDVALIGIAHGALMLVVAPSVVWVVGLSGPLHGLFAANATRLARWPRDRSIRDGWITGPRYGLVLLAGLAAKLTLDVWHATPTEPSLGGAPVAWASHACAAAVGLVWGALVPRRPTLLD